MKNLPPQPRSAHITNRLLHSSKYKFTFAGRHIVRSLPLTPDQRNIISQSRPGMVGPPAEANQVASGWLTLHIGGP